MRTLRQAAAKERRRSAFTVLMVGLLILVIAASATVIIVVEARSSEAQSRRRMQAVATLTQAFVAEQTAGLESLVTAFADRLTATDALEPTARDRSANVAAVLDRLREARPEISVAALTDAAGVLMGVRPDSPALVGNSVADRDWYRGAVRHGPPYMSEVYQSAATGQPFVVTASVAVRGRAANGRPGPLLGVLAATYSLSPFQRFVDRYAADTGIRLVIMDQRGVPVAAPGDPVGGVGGLNARREAGARASLTSGVVAAFVTDPGTGWRVGSAIPLAAARSSSAGFRWVVLTAAGLVMLMVIGAAFGEARLRRSRHRSDEDIAQFFGVSLDLLCIAGTDGFFKRINPAWKTVLGYDEADLLGKPFLAFVHPDDIDATLAEMATLEAGATTVGFENRYRCKDGTFRWILWKTAPLPERRMLYAVARDITERKENEQVLAESAAALTRSNAELQQFAYVASHDLQEPLRKISSYLEVLSEDYADHLDDQAREYIGFAVDGAQRMRRMIVDLLAVSRLRVDMMTVDQCDTGDLVRAIIEDYALAIADAGAVVVVADLPVVQGDQAHLRQAFQNLISNAIKYRGTETLTLHISSQRYEDGWLFVVADNGIGFKQEYAEKAFRMFQRLVGRREYEGTGMGLAIVAKVVENHGGRIWAESQPGVGTTFSFTVPASMTKSLETAER